MELDKCYRMMTHLGRALTEAEYAKDLVVAAKIKELMNELHELQYPSAGNGGQGG